MRGAAPRLAIVLAGSALAAMALVSCQGGGPTRPAAPSPAPQGRATAAPGAAPASGGPAAAPAEPVARGELIYQKTAGGVGCQLCHGVDGRGSTGPDVRAAPADRIANALASVEPMRFITTTTPLGREDVEALAAYLKTLADRS